MERSGYLKMISGMFFGISLGIIFGMKISEYICRPESITSLNLDSPKGNYLKLNLECVESTYFIETTSPNPITPSLNDAVSGELGE